MYGILRPNLTIIVRKGLGVVELVGLVNTLSIYLDRDGTQPEYPPVVLLSCPLLVYPLDTKICCSSHGSQ
jgi:hypothetical protein